MSTDRAALALAVLLSACGTDPSPGDDVGPDAVSGPPVTIDVLPLCQDHTLLVRSADGRQTRTTRRSALIAGVGPGSGYLVQRCGLRIQPTPPACPVGSTCTGATDVPGVHCYDAFRVGEFVDGALLVDCGSRTENFNASGGPDGFYDISYASVKVTTF